METGTERRDRQNPRGFEERLAAFGPSLLAVIVVLAVAWRRQPCASSGRAPAPARFDRFASRSGISRCWPAGIRKPASALATVLAGRPRRLHPARDQRLNLRSRWTSCHRAFICPRCSSPPPSSCWGPGVTFVRRSVLIGAVNGAPSAGPGRRARTALLISSGPWPSSTWAWAPGVDRLLHDPSGPRLRPVFGLQPGRTAPGAKSSSGRSGSRPPPAVDTRAFAKVLRALGNLDLLVRWAMKSAILPPPSPGSG